MGDDRMVARRRLVAPNAGALLRPTGEGWNDVFAKSPRRAERALHLRDHKSRYVLSC